MKNLLLLIIIVSFFISCTSEKSYNNALDAALQSDNPKVRRVMDSLEQYELQILYTQVSRAGDSVVLKDFDFQLNTEKYYYPASSVKFPVAVLAMEKLNKDGRYSIDTKFRIEGDSLITTVRDEVRKLFAVSDNAAYNRLFEFLGQDQINASLKAKGVSPVRISHRVSIPNSGKTVTNRVIFLNESEEEIVSDSIVSDTLQSLKLDAIIKGVGYTVGDSLVKEPFSFELKNYYPVVAQHAVLKRVMFPESFPKSERFNLSDDQRAYLLKSMSSLPAEAGYDSVSYWDGYSKFFMYGDTKEAIPDHIKIYNKIGQAYGTLTDCAYIQDETNGIEFMITATLLVNKNQIFNDGNYEYDEVGLPFLAALGQEIYAWELANR